MLNADTIAAALLALAFLRCLIRHLARKVRP